MSRARQPINHGTAAGYRAHVKWGEPVPGGDPCGCRAAIAAWTAQYRAQTPTVLARAKRHAKVRSRALSRLAEAHPDEYLVLLGAEYAAEREAQR